MLSDQLFLRLFFMHLVLAAFLAEFVDFQLMTICPADIAGSVVVKHFALGALEAD